MPPPLVSVKSAPRGNPIWSSIGRSASGSSAQPTDHQPPSSDNTGVPPPQDHGEHADEAPDATPSEQPVIHRQFHEPPSPSPSHASSALRRPADGGDDIRQVPSQTFGSAPLPTTHSPKHTGVIGPAAIPSSSSDPRAPGSGVFVKRKVKKSASSGDTPQPYRKSPTRAGSDGSSTPGRVRSILRNPIARHSTVTFAADLIGITLDQMDSIPVLKKADVEQSTLRDEVFASLHGPVTSREQITVNITSDEDGQGVRVEGIIDHLRNHDEQNAVIRRLADFLHSPNVFGRSLAPFLALGNQVGAADRSLNDVMQRILVREAKINDVPVKSVAPSSTGQVSAKRGGAATTGNFTPQWDPDFNRSQSSPAPRSHGGGTVVDYSQCVERFEKRRKAYQASLGIVYASPLAIPTPHQGRWDRPNPDPYVVRPDPVEPPARYIAEGEFGNSLRGGGGDTPRSQMGGNNMRPYSFVPHGVVDSPTAAAQAPSAFPPTYGLRQSPNSPASLGQAPLYTPPHLLSSNLSAERILIRDSSHGPRVQQQPGLYRTRQYVTEDPRRRH